MKTPDTEQLRNKTTRYEEFVIKYQLWNSYIIKLPDTTHVPGKICSL